MKEVTVEEFKDKLDQRTSGSIDFHFLDVRNPDELNQAEIKSIDKLIPVAELPDRISEIESWKDSGKEIYILCRSGGRSGRACQILEQAGFKDPINILGGINEYARKVDTSLTPY